jgi:hypothetical protein
MRRLILPCLVALLMCGAGLFAPLARALGANPTTEEFSGYPVLNVTVTDDAYLLDVASVPAGLVVVSVTNATDDSVDAAVVGPAPGQTAAQLIEAAAVPPAKPGDLAPFLYDATLPGGPVAVPPDETREELMLLPAGDWGIFGSYNRTPGIFATADGDKSRTDEPTADVTVDMGDAAFNGLANGVPTGPILWKVTTTSSQPHALMLVGVPAGTTSVDVLAMFGLGEPAGDGPTAVDMIPVSDGVSLQSDGQTLWMPMTLEAGTYAAIDSVPNPATGKSHLEEGMVAVFVVA